MIHRRFLVAAGGLILLTLVSSSGCVTTYGPHLGYPMGVPIPLSPYFQKAMEDKAWWKERYANVPVLDPLAPGVPAIALDTPSDDEVMRNLERSHPVEGGLPFIYETQRTNVRIVKEPISDFIDPPRVYPLIGPAQLHHAHWKCTVYFTEATRYGWPIPHTVTNEDAQEVVMIDHDHFHRVGNVDAGTGPTP